MSKTWLIARYHFQGETRKRTFLLVVLSLPLFLIVTIGLGYLFSRLEEESTTLGYVDQAGLLVQMPVQAAGDSVRMVAFEVQEAAQVALEAGHIDAYYLLAPDYAETHHVELVYYEPPSRPAVHRFENAVRLNLVAGLSPAVIDRLLSGPSVTVRATELHLELPAAGPGAGQFVPLIAAAIFTFLVLTTSGYMMEVLVAEKENRTMEIMVTSVSPAQMMAGKTIGALGIGLIQLLVWLAFLAGAVWLGRSVLRIDWLQNLDVNVRGTTMAVALALPSYLCFAALGALIGSTLIDTQEAHQTGGLFFLPLFLPIYLIVPITQNLNGPLALGLSFFPVTSVMTFALRSLFIEVPVWQFATAGAIALACGAVLVWLAAKALRLSMLRYGQRLKWRDLFSRRRQPSGAATLTQV